MRRMLVLATVQRVSTFIKVNLESDEDPLSFTVTAMDVSLEGSRKLPGPETFVCEMGVDPHEDSSLPSN